MSHVKLIHYHCIIFQTNILTSCYVFSDLEELPGDAFLGLSTLKEIQVSNARVSTLAKNVFNGQRNLKKLSLHNNNITDIVRGTYDFGHSVEHLGRKKLSCHL